ncbi:MAG: phosphoribosylanthranilate isomerase [Clostridiales bacterium]|nr:phosphoribosylanthranilate isomerase [Clostridiales bacterium]
MPVQVKICGLKRPEDVRAVNEAKADYAGFVFFEKSKRNISFETARELLSLLDPDIRSVAVCVSPDIELVRMLSGLGFDIIQIHGEISPEILDQIQTPVWQAVNLKNELNPDLILSHPKICAYVVDGAEYGGGKTFGWDETFCRNQDAKENSNVVRNNEEKAGGYAVEKKNDLRLALHGQKFILAGGLNIDNVAEGIALFHPDIVDVSSGVETDGVKDSTLIHRFVRKARDNP